MTIRILTGDCRDVLPTLEANSVHCCVTSPPYFGLRDYGTAQWDGGDAGCDHTRLRCISSSTLKNDGRAIIGTQPHEKQAQIGTPYLEACGKCGARRIDRQIGLEATPDAYIQTMVEVFREVRRVLRDDGTVWCNMGDSYSSGARTTQCDPSGYTGTATLADGGARRAPAGVAKPKDLLMMPARLALALQADGWWLRSDIIWAKPNPMPESVTDRPTSAHEHVFLLTKAARYFYDSNAVREEAEYGYQRNYSAWVSGATNGDGHRSGGHGSPERNASTGRNLRNVWTIATHAYPEAHFATFPPELAERCIKAGTSEKGACPQCGAPWYRVIDRGELVGTDRGGDYKGRELDALVRRNGGTPGLRYENNTIGWHPTCACDKPGPVVPCTVLDPFSGAGTSGLVADRLGRDAIMIDLNHQYVEMARERLQADCPLFADITDAPVPEPPEDERMADLFAEVAD